MFFILWPLLGKQGASEWEQREPSLSHYIAIGNRKDDDDDDDNDDDDDDNDDDDDDDDDNDDDDDDDDADNDADNDDDNADIVNSVIFTNHSL